MSDPVKSADPITPPPTPAPTPAPTSADQVVVNQRQLDGCAKAEELVVKARNHAALFTPEEIDEIFLSALEADCAEFRALATKSQTKTLAKEDWTRTEEAAHLAVVMAAQDVQSRARQQYHSEAPGRLAGYHINHRLSGVAYATLIQYVQDMINLLTGDEDTPADKLPGMTPALLAALVAARKTYIDANSAQSAEQKNASEARIARNALNAKITANRLKIQFAADRLFPYQLASSAAARSEFELTNNRPFAG